MSNSTPATFKPALILHGGAGNIHRSTLPPDLYAQYHASLLSYLRSTRDLLNAGATALDAAVHAVALMEDDELFNCGRGSVFTSAGTIEMEASVMVTTVKNDQAIPGAIKRGAGVMGLRNVRHPIHLAKECLLRTGSDGAGNPTADGGSMHSQLVAPYVEGLARAWGLEFKPDGWFWTKRRWDEHRRGLEEREDPVGGSGLSQGTVGCVCLDRLGNLAVATSTGGLTNKLPGRIGDTPTLGAGFWAEAWEDGSDCRPLESRDSSSETCTVGVGRLRAALAACIPFWNGPYTPLQKQTPVPRRRAVALSGTGNGDSFLRVAAARTVSSMLRFSASTSLAEAITAVAGPGGELQRSAGRRWGKTAEGMGGIIGIEAEMVPDGVDTEEKKGLLRGKVVFDFNCGGMWRAWIEEVNGREVERVMIFREEYQ